jgi:Tat protein translocase TatB subunit
LGSIGGAELVLILLLALLLFGPRRLPQIGRTLGKALGDLRRATTDFKTNLEREVNLEEVKDLHGNYKSARREISDTVKEFRNLGIPRDLGLDDAEEPSRPAMPAEKPSQSAAGGAEPPTKPSEDVESDRDS